MSLKNNSSKFYRNLIQQQDLLYELDKRLDKKDSNAVENLEETLSRIETKLDILLMQKGK
ncbi:hypothetical protein D0469_11550 [Peribacillus saganii]|uniref:Uncharacterized protein n=1 Tax=Peribacillus saganii TaxID=2303992 RepID=A0A372LNH0_9BACI|nr:hypothetical protein [Peribacillus saganii]RFU68589.1 hypothetical protein D0469_11550 [Peribacillus saganii]